MAEHLNSSDQQTLTEEECLSMLRKANSGVSQVVAFRLPAELYKNLVMRAIKRNVPVSAYVREELFRKR